MDSDDEVIGLLNEVLTAELTAVNQYFLDAKMFDNWGYVRLGHRFREESIGEMKDADELIERVLYLGGHPNVQRLSSIRTGEKAFESCTLHLELERGGDRAAEPGYCPVPRAGRQREPGPPREDPRRRRGPCRLARDPVGIDQPAQ